MRSPNRLGGIAHRIPLLLVVFTLDAYAIGFENGEVHSNAVSTIDGTTTSAAQVLTMSAVSPPITDPPLPSTYAPARATINGTMSSVNLASEGSISGALRQYVSTGGSQVDFVDNLIVNAPGISAETDLIVEVTWLVTGRAEVQGTSTIMRRSKILLEAEGFRLKPSDPPPPRQQWTRDRSNFVNERLDAFGLVSFEFLVQAETPVFDGNIRMRAVTGFLCGGEGSEFTGNYTSSANAEINLTFIGATNVKTTDGLTLYKWTTNAQSGLGYGSRDDDPPSSPVVTVSPSSAGEKLVHLSWGSLPNEYYIVQASTDGTRWNRVTEVLSTGGTISLDIIRPAPSAEYRVVAEFGSGNPSTTASAPALCIIQSDAGVRVAWPTNHWESYVLNEVDAHGNTSQLETTEGTGGAVWFDFPLDTDQRLFQVEASLK